MGLRYNLEKAAGMIHGLDAGEVKDFLGICRTIQLAEGALQEKAAPILLKCMKKCRGLCCRNIQPDNIITLWDFIYILALEPDLKKQMARCIEKQSLFTADCIFLRDGKGPCLFPSDLRPERCIISFCSVEGTIGKEIGMVNTAFNRLVRFFMFRPVRSLCRFIKRLRERSC